jgi:hypothetical protein
MADGVAGTLAALELLREDEDAHWPLFAADSAARCVVRWLLWLDPP